MVSGAALGVLECCQQVGGDDPSPLFSTGDVTPVKLCPVLDSPVRKRDGCILHLKMKSSKGSQRCLRVSTISSVRKDWERWAVQPGEEQAQGDLIKVYKYLKRRVHKGWSQALASGTSDRTRDDGHTLKHRQFPLNIKIYIFTVRVSPSHIPAPPGLDPEPPNTRRSCLRWVLDKVTSRVPFQPQPFCASVWIFHRVQIISLDFYKWEKSMI